jgi:hypothetical protein
MEALYTVGMFRLKTCCSFYRSMPTKERGASSPPCFWRLNTAAVQSMPSYRIRWFLLGKVPFATNHDPHSW